MTSNAGGKQGPRGPIKTFKRAVGGLYSSRLATVVSVFIKCEGP